MSKGSRRRPVDKNNKAIFDSNWDRIFNKARQENTWQHNCKHNGVTFLEKGVECQWCGAQEND